MIKTRLKAFILQILKEENLINGRPRVIVADCLNNTWPTKPNATLFGEAGGYCARVLLDGEEITTTYSWHWVKFPKE